MAASANIELAKAGPSKFAVRVLDGEILYAGAYAALGSRDHGTAGNRGRAFAFADDTDGLIPLGFVDQQKTGDETGTNASGPVDASINLEDVIVRNMTITDDAGDVTDQGRLVYAVDDNTFSLTRPSSNAVAVGMTTRFIAANTFDVYFFSFATMMAISLAGGNRRTWHIGCFAAELGATTGNLLTGIVCPYHGYITDYYLICGSAPADADVAGNVRLEINGTDLDFATANPAIAAADTVGLKISGSGALTATAVHEGDLIDVEGVFSAAGTVMDGLYNVYADIELQPGT